MKRLSKDTLTPKEAELLESYLAIAKRADAAATRATMPNYGNENQLMTAFEAANALQEQSKHH